VQLSRVAQWQVKPRKQVDFDPGPWTNNATARPTKQRAATNKTSITEAASSAQ
jgi:hypothetical protein